MVDRGGGGRERESGRPCDWSKPIKLIFPRFQVAAGRKRVHQVQTEWFELDESKNPNVYIQGLPADITMETLAAFMRKCGIIREDERGMRLDCRHWPPAWNDGGSHAQPR